MGKSAKLLFNPKHWMRDGGGHAGRPSSRAVAHLLRASQACTSVSARLQHTPEKLRMHDQLSVKTPSLKGLDVDQGLAPCHLVRHHHATQTAQGQANVLMTKGINHTC